LSTDFYPEIFALITEEDFKALYDHAVTSCHDFLVVDLSASPDRVWRKGWTHYLHIKEYLVYLNKRMDFNADALIEKPDNAALFKTMKQEHPDIPQKCTGVLPHRLHKIRWQP